MAFIVEQLVGDRGIQIGNEEIIRPFSFGTNWNKIRVGMLFAVNGFSSFPTGVFPIIGICTGNDAMNSPNCVDAVFHRYTYPLGQFLYSGTPPANYYGMSGTSSNLAFQRVGSTNTQFGAGISWWSQFSANPTNQRTGYMFTITKGAVGSATIQYDVIYHVSGGTAGATDVSRGTFLLGMETEAGAVAPMTYSSVTNPSLPLRFVKDWDSMFINWNRATPTMCVYCMSVVRFA